MGKQVGHKSIHKDSNKQSIDWNKSGLNPKPYKSLQAFNSLSSSSCGQTNNMSYIKHRLLGGYKPIISNNRISSHKINKQDHLTYISLLNHHLEIPFLYICHTPRPLFCFTATGHCVEALQSRRCFDQKIQHT